jgi:hypothetical protein
VSSPNELRIERDRQGGFEAAVLVAKFGMPLICFNSSSISVVPNPFLAGFSAAGPPASIHYSARPEELRWIDHDRPFARARLPCFTALVVNSCMRSPSASAAFDCGEITHGSAPFAARLHGHATSPQRAVKQKVPSSSLRPMECIAPK